MDAIARYHGNAGADGFERRIGLERFAVQGDAPFFQRAQPEQTAADFLLTRAAQAGQRKHFTAAQGECHRAGFADYHIIQREQRFSVGRNLRPAQIAFGFLADDGADQIAQGVGRGRPAGDLVAIAHYADIVGDLDHLIQTVGDIDHADPLFLEPLEHREQMAHVVGRQRCGGLIKHQHFGFDCDSTGNGQQRFFGARKIENACIRVEINADFLQCPMCASPYQIPVDQADAAWKTHDQRHVFRDRHPLDQPQILMDEGNRLRGAFFQRGGGFDFLAMKQDAAAIALVNARQHLDQRGFAGAVFTEQRQNLAGLDVDADIVDDGIAAEAFDDAIQPQQRLVWGMRIHLRFLVIIDQSALIRAHTRSSTGIPF